MRFYIFSLALIALSCSFSAMANTHASAFHMTSYLGTGSPQNDDDIRHVTGMRASLQIPIVSTANWALSPEVEAGILLTTTRQQTSALNEVGSFDHKLLGSGLRLQLTTTVLNQNVSWFLKPSAGIAISSLRVDKSSPNAFTKISFDALPGTYTSWETGATASIQEKLSLTLGLAQQTTRMSLDGQYGAVMVEVEGSNGLTLTESTATSEDVNLANRLQQSTLAATLGLMMTF